ncbi:MAG: hypothetical protein IJB22_05495 [Clostridia bacterium]|nr:hypothetical protein [Clostridia bacterium]
MHKNSALSALSKEELLSLLEIYAKNWLAMDGYWFQSIEKKHGMDEAMEHDVNIWRGFTRTEAKRIKKFLSLPENAGLDGLEKALAFRLYACINADEIIRGENELIYRTLECYVQKARSDKGMPYHPCKSVGLVEYALFAKEIDPRIRCECISCYPDVTDESCNCAWRFWMEEE